MRNDTQLVNILNHLEMGYRITPLAALRVFGCFRLADVIYKLKKRGIPIASAMVTENKKTFKKYWLDI